MNMRIFFEEWRMLENSNSSVRTDELENDYQKTFVETNKKRTRPQLIWMTD